MNKINIRVGVQYIVELADVEVDDEMAHLLANYCREPINPDTAKDGKAKVADWILDNICEDDWCDYEATIDDLSINGEPY